LLQGGVAGAPNAGVGAAGGAVNIAGGNATGTGANDGGQVAIIGGAHAGAGADGAVNIGAANTSQVAIGAAANKIGFFGQAPVVQPNGTGYDTVAVGGATPAFRDDTYNGGAGTAYTLGDVIVALKALGLLAA
jgi:hypothetical protein